MTAADWPDVRRIYAEGIATDIATLEREAPDWDTSTARTRPIAGSSRADRPGGRRRLDRAGQYSARRSTAASPGRACTSAESARGRGVGRACSRPSSRPPRRPASGRSWPGSWPRTKPASPSTNASGSAGSASSARLGQDALAGGETSSCSSDGARSSASTTGLTPQRPAAGRSRRSSPRAAHLQRPRSASVGTLPAASAADALTSSSPAAAAERGGRSC